MKPNSTGPPGFTPPVRSAGLMESLLSGPKEDNDTFGFERILLKRGFSQIAGTDEVGRGPLAGPVVAASVILPPDCDYTFFCDSKRTTERQRYLARDRLHEMGAAIGIATVPPEEIDKINIFQASLLAMKQSVGELEKKGITADFILVDGRHTLPLSTPQEALVKGDSRSATIGAASIIAKITRDEIMSEFHQQFPQYNFLAHKGYPTKEHRKNVALYGPSPIHRLSFKGVKEFVERANQSG